MSGGKYLKTILKELRGIRCSREPQSSCHAHVSQHVSASAYEIHHRVLQILDNGINQSRPRWYCVGIRKDLVSANGSNFAWPLNIKRPDIELLLDSTCASRDNASGRESRTAKGNIDSHMKDLKFKHGDDLDKWPYIIDCDSSKKISRYYCGFFLCITRSRFRGHWLTNRPSTNELNGDVSSSRYGSHTI